MKIFDDDDDAEPQLKVVDNYYFEKAKDEFVCFSTLPLKFDEYDKVSEKGIYLRRYAANGPPAVYKKVVAWTVALDCEQPKISVLSSEGYWIELELLKPRKIYWNFARSTLTTVEMLHFFKRQPKKPIKSLCVHLREVFSKFETEEMGDAPGKHHHIIKRCAARDPTLMKSKILESFIKDTSGKYFESILRSLSTKEPFIIAAEPLAREDEGDSDTDNDGKRISDDGDGNEPICAICDEGGELLSCEGRCKRSFHPTTEAGRKSKCKTLGYTAVQVKEMNKFICKNCRDEQHQCFKCGELASSCESNAKVFQCCNEYCGHFYHPKCAAELLQSRSNGTYKLEENIAVGMPFSCPVHWCSRTDCKKMEDMTKRAMWLAGCRRCPRSYHLDCLPREIPFKEYGNRGIRAWFLSERNLHKRHIIYCTDHDIDPAIGTPCRDHIKFPTLLENKGQGSTKSTKFSNKLSQEEGDQSQRVATSSSTGHIILKPECGATHLKNDLQFEPSMVEPAATGALSIPEAIKGKENHLGTLFSFDTQRRIQKISSHAVDNETENRLASMDSKGASQNISSKCVTPSNTAHSASHSGKMRLTSMDSKGASQNISRKCVTPSNTAHSASHSNKMKSVCNYNHSKDDIYLPYPSQNKANAKKLEETGERFEKKRRHEDNKEVGSRSSVEGNEKIEGASISILMGTSWKKSRQDKCYPEF